MTNPPSAQPYVEALPRFNIVTLDAQVKRGARKIGWYDGDGIFVGQATITMPDRFNVALAHITDAIGYVAFSNGADKFTLSRRTHSNADDRPGVICPDCGRVRSLMLLMDDEWKCRICHGVTNLSTMIDAHTRKHIELQELSEIVEMKRQRYVRHDQYNRMVDRHTELLHEIGGEVPRTLASHHLYRVEESYYGADAEVSMRRRSPGPRFLPKKRG